MTICNVNPFGHNDANTLTWSQYMSEMTAKKQNWSHERMRSIMPNLTVMEYDAIWRDLLSQVGYVTNLMPNISSQLRASDSQQLIVNCTLFSKDWNDVNSTCNLHFHWDQTYHRCYTIHIPHDMSTVRDILVIVSLFLMRHIFKYAVLTKYTVSQKTTLMLHTITSTHINRFR